MPVTLAYLPACALRAFESHVPITYLTTSYAERQSVKELGAQWDPKSKKWYVPEGRDLAAFTRWLPGSTDIALAVASPVSDALALSKGVGLAELMAGLAGAVARAYAASVWVRVEVTQVRASRGTVSLELTEAGPDGTAVAQARGLIWNSTAQQIVPLFETATGVVLGPGIKLLLRVRPTLHAQYGLALVIDAIDPEYTLGEMAARRREIRLRLQKQGLFERNRQLATAWDFNAVLVLAPEQAAGLGDFQAEARRLDQAGVCRFTYLSSRFQGEGAAAEMCAALKSGLEHWCMANDGLPDALVIIRGGGAVNDLAWLNDYQLARAVCEMVVPVFTGIGHERDDTILDEVAHTRFDTPSKVIAGIEQTILSRVREARRSFDEIFAAARQLSSVWQRNAEKAQASVLTGAQRHLALARGSSDRLMSGMEASARDTLQRARTRTDAAMAGLREQATRQVATAQQQVPAVLTEVLGSTRRTLKEARTRSAEDFRTTVTMGTSAARRERASVDAALAGLASQARQHIRTGRTGAEALVREVTGQGPEKTLGRGFAVVRTSDGHPLMSAAAAALEPTLQVQFKDGVVPATVQQKGRA
jgi:exodeoxyribonuclease VII large subunit